MSKYEIFAREEFSSIETLMAELKKRPKNNEMKGADSSESESKSFTGTSSYKEALELLAEGYKDILKELKSDIKGKSKITSKLMADIERPIPRTGIVGYVPCVPNAIMGLPNSMITVDRAPMKRKTLSIYYCMGGNCDKKTEYFSKAGAALLSAIDVVEKSGIQTRLNLCFMPVESPNGKELIMPSVIIKNYGERYSLQKISFPMAHPSMFRRIGFKYLETCPVMTQSGYSTGYGRSPDYERVEETIKLEPNTYLLSAEWINKHNCDIEKILKKLEVI